MAERESGDNGGEEVPLANKLLMDALQQRFERMSAQLLEIVNGRIERLEEQVAGQFELRQGQASGSHEAEENNTVVSVT